MKDIIAAVEAQRAAPRAGGGEKRCMAQFGQVVVLAAALALAPSSVAQSMRWTDPAGVWSLDLQGAGWAYGEGLPPGSEVLIAVPFVAPPEHEVRACLAEETFEARDAGESDEAARQRASRIDAQQARAILVRLRIADPVVAHRDVDGVSVADVHALTPNGNRLRAAIFYTPSGGQRMRTTISCFWPATFAADKAGEIETVLASLRINTSERAP